jgi:hypothetical protein
VRAWAVVEVIGAARATLRLFSFFLSFFGAAAAAAPSPCQPASTTSSRMREIDDTASVVVAVVVVATVGSGRSQRWYRASPRAGECSQTTTNSRLRWRSQRRRHVVGYLPATTDAPLVLA